MKTELTSLDLYYLIKEFQEMVGARIDKVYEQDDDKDEFLFAFHKSGVGKMMLRFNLPGVVYLTDYKQVFPESPPGFCVFLRKHLASGKIKEIRQKGFERILEIVFTTKTGIKVLVCELFSKGNMLLLEKDGKIRGLLKSQNWQARTIRGGVKYEYPPDQTNTPSLDEEQFNNIISKSKMDSIVKTLAVDLGLGGLYAEELCKRAGIDKNKKKLDDKELKKLFRELKGLFNEETKANKINNEVLPFELKLEEQNKGMLYKSFNQALDEVITQRVVKEVEARVVKEKQSKEDKVGLIIKKQEERLKALEKSIGDNQKKGELIYEHYQELKCLLEQINIDRKKMDWQDLKKKYKANKLIKEIDEKKGLIIVDF